MNREWAAGAENREWDIGAENGCRDAGQGGGETTVCRVCMHHCRLKPGQIGRCRARAGMSDVSDAFGAGNAAGTVSLNYGKITSLALDPIEKKPLKWFEPGSMILSVGSYGCNLSCPFCQNYEIAAAGENGTQVCRMDPKELAQRALELRPRGNIGVAFTYNEPLIGYEFVRDTAKVVRSLGMKNVIVTNGSVTGPVLDEVLLWTDAMNIDLKGFTESYYEKLGGSLETVKRFIAMAAGRCHIELTTLIVPGENDSPEEMERLAAWVAGVDPWIPLHVTRFFPRWKLTDRPPTKVRTVHELAGVAGNYLRRVCTGNC